MRSKLLIAAAYAISLSPYVIARAGGGGPLQAETERVVDPVKILVDRLDLERYKATIKGLTQFGDRRQGTDRNRAAIDWIEGHLRSYGCTNIERLKYTYQPSTQETSAAQPGNAIAPITAVGGGRSRGVHARTGVNTDPNVQPDLSRS